MLSSGATRLTFVARLNRDWIPIFPIGYGWSLLMIPAMRGNTTIGKLLIEAGADLDCRNKLEIPLRRSRSIPVTHLS